MISHEEKIEAVAVYLEKRKTRTFVGKLYHEDGDFVFEYDTKYLYGKQVIPVGVELPLTNQVYRSNKLFRSFEDRLPSRENPAYGEYCQAAGISENERNLLILLATIGKRGPSSFVFEPIFRHSFDGKSIRDYREWLHLTTREFASCFEISRSSLLRLEHGDHSGNEILKRVEIYVRFPEVALNQIKRKGSILTREKRRSVERKLERKR